MSLLPQVGISGRYFQVGISGRYFQVGISGRYFYTGKYSGKAHSGMEDTGEDYPWYVCQA